MTEVMCLFTDGHFRSAAVEREPSAGDPRETGNHPKEGGFAGAVPSGHQDRFPRRYLKTYRAENLASAPAAGQLLGSEFHHGCRGWFWIGWMAGRTRENPNILCIFSDNLGEYGVGREKTL